MESKNRPIFVTNGMPYVRFVLNTKKPSEVRTFTKKSNHNGAEQGSSLEQERFVWTEITCTLVM